MKEQKIHNAMDYVRSIYGTTNLCSTVVVKDEQSIFYLMDAYSDQQNAELRERVKELEGTVSELRTAFANYWVSEGCSCCRDSDNHRDAEHAIGELLGVAKHDDESGYDFNQYQTIYK